ncbi:MAG: electron transfer flavoprotein [Planctomycetota bacterium]|nr:MAG: electron transfer flavoprotein [Planctomycetota bacterium]
MSEQAPAFRVGQAPSLNVPDAEREQLPVDVCIVGGGPAGLACAIRLGQLVREHNARVEASGQGEPLMPEIVLLEKGAEIGSLGLSGAVMDPRAIRELLGEHWQPEQIEGATAVSRDRVVYLKKKGTAVAFPVIPPPLNNHGKVIVSLAKLLRWLAPQAEELGVQIFTGMPAALPLYAGGEGPAARVVGVQCRDLGIDRHGKPKSNFEPGANITAKVTVLAEGPRGNIAKYLVPYLGLDQGCNAQTYATGVKEVWRLPEGAPERAGEVIHTMGYPLGRKHLGGGWIYFMRERLVSLGYVTYLDYDDPFIDPHREFQRFKLHPFVKEILTGAEIVDYGAKTIVGGGWWAVPRLSHPGVLLVGDAAGFTNTMNLKGIHYAIKSGMLAAETIYEALVADDFGAAMLGRYQQRVEASYIRHELWKARNFHQSFRRGLFWGMFKTGLHMMLGGRGWKARLPSQPDHQHYRTLEQLYGSTEREQLAAARLAEPKYDNAYTFDKVTDVYHSGTTHSEDQPPHLLVREPDICVNRCTVEYGNPCERFCPANVYEMVEDEAEPGRRRLQLNFANCVHCKTCDIKDPYAIIDWVPPEGGGGPKYTWT